MLKHQTLLSVQDSLTRKYELLNKVCDFNKYTLQVLIDSAEAKHGLADETMTEPVKLDENEDDGDENYILLNNRASRNVTQNGNSSTDESEDGDSD